MLRELRWLPILLFLACNEPLFTWKAVVQPLSCNDSSAPPPPIRRLPPPRLTSPAGPPPAGSISTWQGGMEESYSIEEFQGRLFRCHVSSALWRRMAALTLGRVRDVLIPRDSMKIGVAVAKGPTPKGIPRQGLEGAFVKTSGAANRSSTWSKGKDWFFSVQRQIRLPESFFSLPGGGVDGVNHRGLGLCHHIPAGFPPWLTHEIRLELVIIRLSIYCPSLCLPTPAELPPWGLASPRIPCILHTVT